LRSNPSNFLAFTRRSALPPPRRSPNQRAYRKQWVLLLIATPLAAVILVIFGRRTLAAGHRFIAALPPGEAPVLLGALPARRTRSSSPRRKRDGADGSALLAS
jgi:hypothetical protein